jgi:hypothetical protein
LAIRESRIHVNRRVEFVSPSRPSFENILPELKTVLPDADFVIEGYVDPRAALREEGPFGDCGEVRKNEPLIPIRHSSFGLRYSLLSTIIGIPSPPKMLVENQPLSG